MKSVGLLVSIGFFGALASTSANADVSDRLKIIKAFGHLRCGVIDDVPEMSEKQGAQYVGYDVDFCNDFGKLLNVATVEIVPVADGGQFNGLLYNQRFDVLFGHTRPPDASGYDVEISIPYLAYNDSDIRVVISPKGDRGLAKTINQFILQQITSGRQQHLYTLWTAQPPIDLLSKTCGWAACLWLTN